MDDTKLTDMLIETKFYRPGLPVDMVHRPRLTAFLKKRQHSRPLTLISAAAGYGKSTLLSCWLDRADCPNAWLSLDEGDNDLQRFLRYFLAAIQTVFPAALQDSRNLLTGNSKLPVEVIANTLINEIHQIEEFFILALDDYHLIQEQSIHDLLNEILLHPPPNFHLVISTRMDPPLSLVSLRGKGQLTEVRIPSLRFNKEESLRLFNKMMDISIEEDRFAEIDGKVEGWVTGLRLAALAMRHRVGREAFDLKLTLNNRYVSEYLLSEIFAKQAITLTDCMLKTSIPTRFNADLCEALCITGANASNAGSDFNGYQFMEWLRTSNLFIITLDDRDTWYRYHHIFREFLQQELVRRFGYEEIRELHAVAGRWYAENDLVDEAFYHLLPSGEVSQAIELVTQHRYGMLNEARWQPLENWLNLFQDHIIESSPELWMLKTWLAYHRGQFSQLPALLQQLDAMLEIDHNQETADRLAGEIHSLRSLVAYYSNDAEGTISQARMALERVPSELWVVRVMARLYLARGLLMSGDQNSSYRAIYDAFEEEKVQNKSFKATILGVVCNIYWLAADLHSLQEVANKSITLCLKLDFREILRISYDHLGKVKYQQNDLPDAEELFASVVENPYVNYGTAYVNSVCGLSMTYQAQRREAEARQVAKEGMAFLLETGNTTQLPIIQALQAELALRQGDLATAKQWAASLGLVPPLLPVSGIFTPHLTLVRVWLAQDTSLSREKASKLLTELQDYLEGTHNTRFLIETLATRALLEQTLGDQEAAQAALERALRLAQAGGFIRIFVDEGPEMARLLAQLKVDDDLRDYVGKIRSAFPGLQQTQKALRQGELLDPLTDRELEILELLQERLSNKEIANRMVISPGTVKGHTIKIYQKLGVNSRRQAVEKALTLGLLALA